MGKVYITTHHRVINFGGVLQAYALQAFLGIVGHDSELVLIKNKKMKKKATGIKGQIYKMLQFGYKTLHFYEIKQCKKNFNRFFEKYHKTTREYSNMEDLRNNPPTDGIYLSGSDQVFNPLNDKPHFFLQFGPKEIKRVSYAASVSVKSVPKSREAEFENALSGFDAVSIRESYSKELVEKYCKKDVNVHIDPSYLLNTEDWKKVSDDKIASKLKKPYILVYALYKPKWLNGYLQKLKKETGYDIVLVSYGNCLFLKSDKYVKSAGPAEFLGLIENAAMVVSSSYHGCVFSSIFRKPFYAIVNPDSPARIMSMLELFGLEERVLNTEKSVDLNVDYTKFEARLKEEQKRSEIYLKKVLEG